MTEFFKSPLRIFQLRGGQNGQLLDTFLRELQQSGFAKITVRRHIRTAEHLLYWARLKGISPSAFNEDTVDKFARHLTRCRCKGYLPKATSSRGDRPRNTRPLDRHLGTDIVLAQGARILREALQQSALGMQLETHGATDCQIRLHVLNQHEVTSGHGWAISRSPTTSTFA